MKNKKIKLFLGAYINSTNAQNLNCLAIAKHIDKEQFEVFTLKLFSGNLEYQPLKSVHTFTCFNPHRISKYLGYIWGIWKCDVAYLPKREIMGWNSFWLKLLRKKSFSTVEGILDKENIKSAVASRGSYANVIQSFMGFDALFSITKFLGIYNEKHHQIISEKQILYLGTNTETFLNPKKRVSELKNIIYIGRLFERKGVYDFLSIAKKFPGLQFHLVGDGDQKEQILKTIQDKQLKNIKVHGILDHEALGKLLDTMDLHILPSRSEGFPKVTLETACAGVPSLLYPDYGAEEWITNDWNGFIVKDVFEAELKINELLKDSAKLQKVSKNVIQLGKSFSWEIRIKDWEKVFMEIARN